MLVRLPAALLFVCALAEGQNPTAHTPTSYVNAKYVNGVAPGYAPTQGSGLVLNIGPGSCFTGSGVTNYAGGTLTLTASATNYVFVNATTCAPAFNTTGFSSLPIAVVTTGGSAISLVTDERLTLNDSSSTLPFLQAASFTGATTNAQALTACQSLVGAPGVVIIAPTMPADTTPEAYPQGCTVEDLRGLVGPNQFGTEGTAYAFNHLFRETFRTAPNAVQNYGPIAVFEDQESGGFNTTGGPKTTYIGNQSTVVSRAQGSHYGYQELMGGFGEGDQVGYIGYNSCFGGSNAGGDEGCEAFHFEADQGNGPLASASSNIFTGTLTGAVNNGSTMTLTYSSATNENTRGELRWMIDTNVSKEYTTGTISGITGAPPTVTGSGTSWATQFGSGTHTDLAFSLAANDNGTLQQVIPIRSITDNTHLVLGYNVQGADKPWSGLANPTGSYRIYYASKVAPGGVANGLGTITVTNGTSQWANGDTFTMPLGFDTFISGNFVAIGPLLPMALIPTALHIVNLAPALYQSNTWGIQVGFNSPFARGIVIDPGQNNMDDAVDCNDGNGVTLSHCLFMDQLTANTDIEWVWNVGTDGAHIGFDRTSGQLIVHDGVNGDLLNVDNNSGPRDLHTGRVVFDKQTNITSAQIAFSPGWNTPTGLIISNNCKDQACEIVFTTPASGLSDNPSVTITFRDGAFATAPFCQGTFQANAVASAANSFPTTSTVQFQFPSVTPGVGVTPQAGTQYDFTWLCLSGS